MEMSRIGKEMLAFQELLAEQHNYEPLNQLSMFDEDVREKYLRNLPEWCSIVGDQNKELRSLNGTLLAVGYNRIVIGDYGAFIEIDPDHIVKENLRVKEGQEYRSTDPRFADRVKYFWLTATDKSNCKVYLQQKRVSYADYLPGMYYISPYEVYAGD